MDKVGKVIKIFDKEAFNVQRKIVPLVSHQLPTFEAAQKWKATICRHQEYSTKMYDY